MKIGGGVSTNPEWEGGVNSSDFPTPLPLDETLVYVVVVY